MKPWVKEKEHTCPSCCDDPDDPPCQTCLGEGVIFCDGGCELCIDEYADYLDNLKDIAEQY